MFGFALGSTYGSADMLRLHWTCFRRFGILVSGELLREIIVLPFYLLPVFLPVLLTAGVS